MAIAKCPRCREETLESLKTHSYCSHCNYSAETAEDADMVIPMWAMKYLGELTPDDREDIREINLGMYTPGYELVVKRAPEPAKTAQITKAAQRSRLPRRMQARLKRRGPSGLSEHEMKIISYFERMGRVPMTGRYAHATNQ